MSMELLIKIPQEFEQHFKQDAFENSLYRLSADAHLVAGNYEQETAKMLRDSFKNAVPVPPHGRLGDLDKLENGLRHMAKYQYGERQRGILGCCETIRMAPTIVPAEEGE